MRLVSEWAPGQSSLLSAQCAHADLNWIKKSSGRISAFCLLRGWHFRPLRASLVDLAGGVTLQAADDLLAQVSCREGNRGSGVSRLSPRQPPTPPASPTRGGRRRPRRLPAGWTPEAWDDAEAASLSAGARLPGGRSR